MSSGSRFAAAVLSMVVEKSGHWELDAGGYVITAVRRAEKGDRRSHADDLPLILYTVQHSSCCKGCTYSEWVFPSQVKISR